MSKKLYLPMEIMAIISSFDGTNSVKNTSKSIKSMSEQYESNALMHNNYLKHFNKYFVQTGFLVMPGIDIYTDGSYDYIEMKYRNDVNWKNHSNRIYKTHKRFGLAKIKVGWFSLINAPANRTSRMQKYIEISDPALYPQELVINNKILSEQIYKNYPEKIYSNIIITNTIVPKHFFDNLFIDELTIDQTRAEIKDKIYIADNSSEIVSVEIRCNNEISFLKIPTFENILKIRVDSKDNCIVDVSNLQKMFRLSKIVLCGGEITKWPDECDMNNLSRLSIIDNNNLVKIPHQIFDYSNIKHLSFKNCKNLPSVPNDIKKLKKLESLNVKNTKVGTIPRVINDINYLNKTNKESQLKFEFTRNDCSTKCYGCFISSLFCCLMSCAFSADRCINCGEGVLVNCGVMKPKPRTRSPPFF